MRVRRRDIENLLLSGERSDRPAGYSTEIGPAPRKRSQCSRRAQPLPGLGYRLKADGREPADGRLSAAARRPSADDAAAYCQLPRPGARVGHPRALEVLLRHAALAVGGVGERDALVVDGDVGMVIGRLGAGDESAHERDGLGKAGERELPDDGVAARNASRRARAGARSIRSRDSRDMGLARFVHLQHARELLQQAADDEDGGGEEEEGGPERVEDEAAGRERRPREVERRRARTPITNRPWNSRPSTRRQTNGVVAPHVARTGAGPTRAPGRPTAGTPRRTVSSRNTSSRAAIRS